MDKDNGIAPVKQKASASATKDFFRISFILSPVPTNTESESFYLEKNSSLELNTCDLGSSTFNDESLVTFVNCFSTEDGNTLPPIAFGEMGFVGSMLGEGSLTMIIALLAFITSGVSLFLIVDMKKKLVPAVANSAEETEDE